MWWNSSSRVNVVFSISFIPNIERNQCADWIFSYQVCTLKDKIIGGLKHTFFLKVALKFCLQIYWMYMYTSTHFSPKHSWLTFTLDQVKVELLQRPHGNLSDIIIHQEVHQGSCHMFTSRHAGSFSNLLL